MSLNGLLLKSLLGAVYMISGTRVTLPPELPKERQNYIHYITFNLCLYGNFSSVYMESFQLVSAGRVTLAVGTPCLQNRVTLGRRDNFCPCKKFVSASTDNFSFPDSQVFKQITACFRSHNLAL
jgi:hypothetical protein